MRNLSKAHDALEFVAKVLFTLAAALSILAVILICVFLFAGGVPAIGTIGPAKFLLGRIWRPSSEIYGIFPMILGSVYVTIGALIIGVPLGIFTAAYLSRFAKPSIAKVLSRGIDLLAGIPSVVFGFFGLMVLVPLIRSIFHVQGMSLLTASIILGIMVLPTIVSVSKTAMDSVPDSYYEGARALGADHERAVFRTILPAASSGVLAAITLGIGRAIGETMAVVMIAGNQPIIPTNMLRGVRTLTANVVLEMGYAADLHREALIATAVVLFVFVLLINLTVTALKARSAA
ncbi:phosphate ABC transporter permease subunit PstC [Atopobium fossor]|uniref:phosphate ABC transporter permease subunit PstC n=1 Tax=Atopobium fossor TaxID=39487 RepID=UPI000404CA4D|nr:phosphate ABC transporter permease subunit PstC [Atopobium fossor]